MYFYSHLLAAPNDKAETIQETTDVALSHYVCTWELRHSAACFANVTSYYEQNKQLASVCSNMDSQLYFSLQ
jgi:hypothetical protein